VAKRIQCIGLLANPEKPHCRSVVRRAIGLMERAGREVWLEETTRAALGLGRAPGLRASALGAKTDLVLVFGGDGTMLRAAREIAGSGTPILGINTGGLGFLTAASASRLGQALNRVWRGAYVLERRQLIVARHPNRGGEERQEALNDFVISRTAVPRLIELEVSVDRAVLTRYRCDGLIVSSPTGSTAYSLAAGGAVVTPDAPVFALTPICPHTLSNRSVIISFTSTIRVRVLSSRVVTMLTADGQVQTQLTGGSVITVGRSRRAVQLVRFAGQSFFETLRQKLNWSGSSLSP